MNLGKEGEKLYTMKLFKRTGCSACDELLDAAQAAGAQIYDIGEANGLAEAAWHGLLTDHDLAVPLLLTIKLKRNPDNILESIEEIIRDISEIRRHIKIDNKSRCKATIWKLERSPGAWDVPRYKIKQCSRIVISGEDFCWQHQRKSILGRKN